ncbi:ABC transporter ATP-binding protein, partial [Mycobacterium tuberculosis]|nr:ABC transporter ATP-binding protein [Mycobacterium tuberculosis]
VRIPSPERRLANYPHEMSGGMLQRAMIAMALACNPKVLLADEPTTALDATVQIQILLLIRELQREYGLSVLFVTHDIGVAAEIADRIAVISRGHLSPTYDAHVVTLETIGLLMGGAHGGPAAIDKATGLRKADQHAL